MTPSDVGDRLKEYVLGEFDRAARLLARRGARHERIHAARKSIRRARAALRLARKLLGEPAANALDASGEIGASLAPLRDAHVAVTTLAALAAHSGARDDRELLRRVGRIFTTRRSARFAEFLAHDPAFGALRARLRNLRDALEALPWSRVTAHALGKMLAHDIRHAGRVGARADACTDGELRHRWRRRVRRVRYEIKAAAHALGHPAGVHANWSWPAHGRSGRQRVKLAVRQNVLRDLTDRLGHEHDLRMVYAALRTTDGIDRSERSSARRIVRRAIAAASQPLGSGPA